MWKHAAFVQARKATLVTTDKDFEHVRPVLRIPLDWEYGDPREMGGIRQPRTSQEARRVRRPRSFILFSPFFYLHPLSMYHQGKWPSKFGLFVLRVPDAPQLD